MSVKTHLALSTAIMLYFLPHINNKTVFIPTIILAGLIPEARDIIIPKNHSLFKSLGKRTIFGEIIRTYTFCIPISVILASLAPVFALPFFLGHSFNLFLNAFTTEGITPFWPIYKKKTNGPINPGGLVDKTLFYTFLVVSAALFIKLII